LKFNLKKPAPHHTKHLLAYLYLYPHHLIPAWFVCLAPAPYPLLSTLPLTHHPAPQRCRKALKNKHLLYICKALKVKGFTHCGKLAERMRKGCGKTCGIKQIVENQALREILSAFPHMRKDISQTRRSDPPRPLARFLHSRTRFFYTFTLNRNMRNKMRKTFENQGFEFFRKSFRMLSASFPQTCTFAKSIR
jgi:hypothetical protein